MTVGDKEILDSLTKQCDSIDRKITSYHLVGARVLGIGTAVIAGLLAVSIKQKFDTVLLMLPIAMYAVLFYWINTNTWIVSQGGYKRYLEERINELVGEKIYIWESALIERRHTNISNITLDIIYIFVLLLSIGGSLYAALGNDRLLLVVLFVNSFFVVAMVVSFANLKSEFQRTYEDAKIYAGKSKDT